MNKNILIVIILIIILSAGILIWQFWLEKETFHDAQKVLKELDAELPIRQTENVLKLAMEIKELQDMAFLYDKPLVRELELVSQEGEKKVVKNCREYLCSRNDGFGALIRGARNDEINYFETPCFTLQFFNKSKASKVSYLSDFNLKDNFFDLPIEQIFGFNQMGALATSIEDIINSEIIEADNIFIKGENYEIIHEYGYPFSFSIYLMGWGDFNHDGIEEMLLYTDIKNTFWGYSNLEPVIISKTSKKGPLVVTKEDPRDLLAEPLLGLCKEGHALKENPEEEKLEGVDACKRIESELEKDECIVLVANREGNLSACDQIKDLSRRDNCYLELLKTHYTGKFDLIEVNKNLYTLEHLCRSIKSIEIKDDCRLLNAREEKSSLGCAIIEDSTKRINCYRFLGIDWVNWRSVLDRELGIELTLSDNFMKNFGVPYYSHTHEGESGRYVLFNFMLPESYVETGLRLRAYTPDYENNLTFPLIGDWQGGGDVEERCLNYETYYLRECKVFKTIDGEAVALETMLNVYEGTCDPWIVVYFNNHSDRPYKGINFILELPDFGTRISSFHNPLSGGTGSELISEFYSQSQNLMKGQYLSSRDAKQFNLFNEMLDSIKFVR